MMGVKHNKELVSKRGLESYLHKITLRKGWWMNVGQVQNLRPLNEIGLFEDT
jgi:hypothetical protein